MEYVVPRRSADQPQTSSAIGFVMLLCCGLVAAWLSWEQREADHWVRHTSAVENLLDRMQILGMRAEIDRRGYLLRPQPALRRESEAARESALARLDELATVTADNLSQQRRIGVLRVAMAERFAEMKRTVELVDAGRLVDARRIVTGIPSETARLRLVGLIQAFRTEEVRLFAERRDRAHRVELLARAALVTGLVLILCLAISVWRERRRQLRALEDTNDQLERDITLREEVEAQLALLAANATDAVFRVDLDGKFLYASPSTRDVFGIAPEAVVGRDLGLGVHTDDRALLVYAREQLLSGARDRVIVSYRTAVPDRPGAWRWVESNAGLVRDPDGSPAELIAAIRDVTHRKELEAKLDAARARAEAAVKARSSFFAHMSHEIRTPMNGVVGFADLLLAGDLGPEQRRQVELIADSGRAMMRLLNDVLDASKIEAGQMSIAHEPFDLAHALRACLKLVTPAVVQKGLALGSEIDPALPKRVCGDGLRLRQIILNLLANAAKFTGEGSITLRARAVLGQGGDRLLVEVEDTGIGIDPARQEAIFSAFVQADSSISGRFGGTGLGLPISAELARLMGGSLRVRSEPGHGACFLLDLPLLSDAECDPAVEVPGFAEPAAAGPVPLRVLVAEDHDVNQILITTMLKQLGAEAELAADGAEAVALAIAARDRGAPFQVVLMDMQMPVMDGLEAARRLRAAGFGQDALPILALTANAYADDVAACLASGMQGHLAKPVRLADLSVAFGRWAGKATGAPKPGLKLGDGVRERYRARKRETLAALDELVRHGRFDEAELDHAALLLHKLAGTAGIFGDGPLGERAQALEDGLARWPEAERAERIRAAVDAMREAA